MTGNGLEGRGLVRLRLWRLEAGRVHCCQPSHVSLTAGPTLRCLLRGGELMALMLLLIVHPRSARSAGTARSPLYVSWPIWRIWAVLQVRREELRIFCRQPRHSIRNNSRGGPLA